MAAASLRPGFIRGTAVNTHYIAPSLRLTIVMTSAEDNPSARTGYRDELHALAAGIIVAAGTLG